MQATCELCREPFDHGWGRRTPRWCSVCRRRAYGASDLLRKYGITLDDYARLLKQQAGLCAICGQHETVRHKSGKLRELDIDHDHVTGRVRGLLCSRCNRGIGTFRDDPDRLRAAAEYLEVRCAV